MLSGRLNYRAGTMTAFSAEGPDDDLSLIEAARTGNRAAFQELVTRYQGLAFSYAFALTGSPTLTEEVAQEAFLSAWRALPEMRPPYNFRGWLLRILRNGSFYRMRSERLHRLTGSGKAEGTAEVESTQASPLEGLITHEEAHAVHRALGGIPDIYRLPLTLYYGEEQ